MEKSCHISISFSEEVRRKAAFIAQQEQRTLSGYVRQLVREDIRAFEQEHGDIQPPTGESFDP